MSDGCRGFETVQSMNVYRSRTHRAVLTCGLGG
jgi:hypothetical protein